MKKILFALSALALLAACDKTPKEAPKPAPASVQATLVPETPPTDKWVGKWVGVEGWWNTPRVGCTEKPQ
ncbi:MAG: lipoprotein, partial [Pseudomonas sp.]|nr:lipoprotein [Pseudomonas sp.]